METFDIKTFGCKTNASESAIIAEKLEKAGFSQNRGDNPGIFIVNSCSVTGEADKKALSALKSAKNKGCVTVLTGCFAQLNPALREKYDFVDFIVGNAEKYDIPEILKNNVHDAVSDIFEQKKFVFEKFSTTSKTRAVVKVQDGCNNRCSYCTICLARGKSRSASEDDVISQIEDLTKAGFNEVVITGIHVGQWGEDLLPARTLADLLGKIEKTDIKSYRLGSLDPNELSDEFIDFLSISDKFCPHFHLSLQSLNDKTLKKMNRHYGFEKIAHVINYINDKFENPFLGCDIIVGFPGETREDFELTKERLQNSKLSQIHVFPYSKRPGTTAFSMPEQVETSEKHNRVLEVKNISEQKHAEFLQKNIGSECYVTIEKKLDRKTGLYKAVTPNYIKVLVKSDEDIKNKYLKIVLDRVSGENVEASVVSG